MSPKPENPITLSISSKLLSLDKIKTTAKSVKLEENWPTAKIVKAFFITTASTDIARFASGNSKKGKK